MNSDRLMKCCEMLGINHTEAFRRVASGTFERKGNDIASRNAVFYLMRTWQVGPVTLSYPEIASAAGITGHATVIDGVHRVMYYEEMLKRIRAATDQLVAQGQIVRTPTPRSPK